MTRTYAVSQLATTAAGARPCAFGQAWLPSGVATAAMKRHGNAITRPLGRLRD
jgi:hypothetical protein